VRIRRRCEQSGDVSIPDRRVGCLCGGGCRGGERRAAGFVERVLQVPGVVAGGAVWTAPRGTRTLGVRSGIRNRPESATERGTRLSARAAVYLRLTLHPRAPHDDATLDVPLERYAAAAGIRVGAIWARAARGSASQTRSAGERRHSATIRPDGSTRQTGCRAHSYPSSGQHADSCACEVRSKP
jgi:hypothetical protein